MNLTHWFDTRRDLWVRRGHKRALTDKIDAGDVIAEVRGDLVAWSTPGPGSPSTMRVGLRGGHAIRKLLRSCEELDGKVPGLRAALEGHTCRFSMAGSSGPMSFPFEARVRVEQRTLVAEFSYPGEETARAAQGQPPAGTSSDTGSASEVLARIRDGRDTVALWGAGNLAPSMIEHHWGALLARRPEGAPGVWAFLHVGRVGLALRSDPGGISGELELGTLWQDPDEVQDQVDPLLARMVRGEDVKAAIESVAAAHPKSELARELALGSHGFALAIAGGALAGYWLVKDYMSLAAALPRSAEVVESYRKVVDAACACSNLACARKAQSLRAQWAEQYGKQTVDNDSAEELHALGERYRKCMSPYAQ